MPEQGMILPEKLVEGRRPIVAPIKQHMLSVAQIAYRSCQDPVPLLIYSYTSF